MYIYITLTYSETLPGLQGRAWIRVLHSLHGQSLGYQSFIGFLKELNYEICFNSLCTLFQILGPKQAMLSEPL